MNKKELKVEIEQYISNLRISIETFRLYKGIKSFVPQYKKEINYISNFLQVTLISLQTTFIMETVKLVDIRGMKNIFKLLALCENNYKTFPTEFSYEVLLEECGKKEKFIDRINIREDLNRSQEILADYSDLINNLKGLRDKYYAHPDKEYFFDVKQAFLDFNINGDKFEKLLDDLLKILNMLLNDLCREQYCITNSSIGDVENILKIIANRN